MSGVNIEPFGQVVDTFVNRVTAVIPGDLMKGMMEQRYPSRHWSRSGRKMSVGMFDVRPGDIVFKVLNYGADFRGNIPEGWDDGPNGYGSGGGGGGVYNHPSITEGLAAAAMASGMMDSGRTKDPVVCTITENLPEEMVGPPFGTVVNGQKAEAGKDMSLVIAVEGNLPFQNTTGDKMELTEAYAIRPPHTDAVKAAKTARTSETPDSFCPFRFHVAPLNANEQATYSLGARVIDIPKKKVHADVDEANTSIDDLYKKFQEIQTELASVKTPTVGLRESVARGQYGHFHYTDYRPRLTINMAS